MMAYNEAVHPLRRMRHPQIEQTPFTQLWVRLIRCASREATLTWLGLAAIEPAGLVSTETGTLSGEAGFGDAAVALAEQDGRARAEDEEEAEERGQQTEPRPRQAHVFNPISSTLPLPPEGLSLS